MWTIEAAFLLVGIVLYLPIECSAFHLGCTGVSFSNTFRFPNVPLLDGIRHIHTIEHLENITLPVSAGGQAPCHHYFDIQRVAQPQRYGDHVSVCVHCSVKGSPQTLYMLARPEAPESCTIMCVRNGSQQAMVHLRVGALPFSEQGHRLQMECTYFIGARLLDRDMEPTFRFLRFFEKRLRWQGLQVAARQPQSHANLLWYRRMVLGLRANDNESPLS
jgi:hypothetical protein